jgi:hypothetical protein
LTIVDANVLLYAVNSNDPSHRQSRGWLERALAGTTPIGFPWISLLAFLRLSTHRSVFPRPLSLEDAAAAVEAWLAQPAAEVVHPTTRHLAVLRGLLVHVQGPANVVNDAHLAALAIEHGASIASFDRDFERFPGLRRVQPA